MFNHKWNCLFSFLVLLCTSFLSIPVKAQSNYQFYWGEGVETFDQKIEVACAYFGCNSNQLKRVMDCESGGNPFAVNRREKGQPSGLFQYKFQTWQNFTQKAGIPDADIWDTDSQIFTTAWAFSNNLGSHWACK